MNNNPCQLHNDEMCYLCDRYELILETWNGRKEVMQFWVGQDAGFSWGPMGMDDTVLVKFIPASYKPQ